MIVNGHGGGNESLSNNQCVSDQDRKAYAKSLIAACRRKKLDAIAITDHHDMALFKYVRDAAALELDQDDQPISLGKQIVVFPGMEITINPCQLLLLFDANFPIDQIREVYSRLGIEAFAETEAKTVETQQLSSLSTADEIKNTLDLLPSFKDRFILLPNLGENHRHSLLRGGHQDNYKEMHCVGGYLDGAFEGLYTGRKEIILGKQPDYGNRSLAYFQTSDNRSADHSKLGEHTSWVKWSKPTAEALRQACLAKESRIFDTEPNLPDVIIKSVKISDSSFLGAAEIDLNKQYNTFIGGRGTGKSTILEYIRWCLCDHNNDDLLKNTLKPLNASVTVEVFIDRTSHFITRDSSSGNVSLRIGDNVESSILQEDVRRRFPIQTYSQGEISDLSQDPEALKRFVETPEKEGLDEIDQSLKDLKPQLKRAYQERLNLRDIEDKIRAGQSEIQSSRARIESFKSELSNISDDDLKLIDQKDGYDQADLYFKNLEATANQVLSHFTQSITWMQSVLQPPETDALSGLNFEDSFFEDIYAALNHSIETTATTINIAIKAIKTTLDELRKDKISVFERSHQEYKSKYDEVFNRLTEHQRRLDRIKELNLEIQQTNADLATLKLQKEDAEKVANEYESLRQEWKDRIIERDNLLEKQCEELTQQSQNYITATLSKEVSMDRLCKSLFDALDGSRMREDRIVSYQ